MKKLFFAGIVLLLGIFFWWKLKLSLTRYFDVDEYAYIHWAYQMFSGRVPYRDFFFYIPPGFLWVLAPVFAFFHGTGAFLAGRVVAFIIFSALSLVTGIVFWEMRKSWIAILVPLLLVFLPLPSDKFLEIRPDTLAMLLAMLGLLFQVHVASQDLLLRSKSRSFMYSFFMYFFFAGFCYGLSLLVLPKALPQVLVGVAFALFSKQISFFTGLIVPWIAFGLWTVGTGDPGLVWYSILKLPKEVGGETARMFPMQPDLFFYPNATYYGENGWSVGLLVNHALWLVGLTMGLFRLLVPKSRKELLIAASLFSHVLFFFWIYPQRHAQYLIPIAVFVSWYLADFVHSVWKKMPKVAYVAALVFLYQIFIQVNSPKLMWNNKEPLEAIQNLYATIPFDQYLLDLDGRTVYYKDPSYVCCLPYGEFSGVMSRKLPALIPVLEQTNTRYIYEGELLRVNTLPADEKQYIRTHFTPHSTIPGLLQRN